MTKFFIYYLICIAWYAKMCNSEAVIVRKCCDMSERYNFNNKICVPKLNNNNSEFSYTKIFLKRNSTHWVKSVGNFPTIEKMEICEGKVFKDDRYKVTQTGNLVKYLSDIQNYYSFFNDFCLDNDDETGKNVVIICSKNEETVKKCCPLEYEFNKVNNNYKCHKNNGTIYHNDIVEKFFGGRERKPNIEFKISKENDFKDYKIIENIQGIIDSAKESQSFCVEKVNDEWQQIMKVELKIMDNIDISAIISIISVLSVIVTILFYIKSNKCQSMAIRLLIVYGLSLAIALFLEIIHKFAKIQCLNFWRDILFGFSFYILNAIWLETIFKISKSASTCLNFLGKLFMPIPGFILIVFILYNIQHEISSTNFLFVIILTTTVATIHLYLYSYFKGIKTNLKKFYKRLKIYTFTSLTLLCGSYIWQFWKDDAFYVEITYASLGVVWFLAFFYFKKVYGFLCKQQSFSDDDFTNSLNNFETKYLSKNGTRV